MSRKETLEQRVRSIERQLAALARSKEPARARSRLPSEGMGLLDALAGRRGNNYESGERCGAVAYAGAMAFGEREYRWIMEHGLPEVTGADWSEAAAILLSLGSPVRLTLLRRLLDGPCNRQALQDALGDTTSGQLYHHLRELQATRIVIQRKRGEYEIAAAALVPLIVVLSVALDLASSREEHADAGK
jgi:DNA-binding transcriptional ArsR family regulator